MAPSPHLLENQHVLLTGATRGIGRSLALRLAGEKVNLSICGRDADALSRVEAEAAERGAAAVFARPFDLADAAAIEDFCREACERCGDVDVLVNNAGFNSRKAPVHEIDLEEFDSILAVNLRAPLVFVRAVLPAMTARGSGHIVNILSTVCHHSMETMGAYTAAKKGFEGLHGVLLKEARPHGVRVTAIYPGGTDTEFRPNRRPDYMHPDSVAEGLCRVLTMPADLIVHDLTFRPMVESNF